MLNFLRLNKYTSLLLLIVLVGTIGIQTYQAYEAHAIAFGAEIVYDPKSDIQRIIEFIVENAIDVASLAKQAISAANSYITSAGITSLQVKEYVLDPLANLAAQTIIRAMTQQILGWIQGNDSGFVQNFDQAFRQAADQAGGEFLNKITGLNLCGNIGAFINISLRTPGLRQRVECTVTDIVKNVQNFYRNFSQGGWPAFIRISLEPQNNPAGAFLIALDAKIEAENRARQRIGRADKAEGFLGFRVPVQKNCVTVSSNITQKDADVATGLSVDPGQKKLTVVGPGPKDIDPINKVCETEYETKTPGEVFAKGLKDSIYSGLDSAKLADEINEAIASILTALLNKVIASSSGSGGGVISGDFSDIPNPGDVGPSPLKFFTDKIDETFAKIQQAQIIITGKIQSGGTNPTSCIPAGIPPEQAAGITCPGTKTELLQSLEKINVAGGTILGFRVKLVETTDPNEIQNINNQLTGILSSTEQTIQDAVGVVNVSLKSGPHENVLHFTDNAKTLGTGAIAFLAQKGASTATALSGDLSQQKTELENLLKDLDVLRAKFVSEQASGAIALKTIQDLLGQILKISDKVLAIYKL